MLRVAIKDLLGRKLRLFLTSLAIVMGVAMVSGTFVLTDTIDAAFSQIFTTAYSSSDAVVTGKALFGGSQNAPSFPASTLTRVEALPGVAAASGGIGDIAQYVDAQNKVVSHGGAPSLAFSVSAAADQRFNPLTLLHGHWPVGSHEVGVDATTAKTLGLSVGGTVGLLPRGGKEQRFTVAGIVQYGHSTLGGASLAIFDLATAQALFHKQGELDQIDVAAKGGVSTAELLKQVSSVLPPHTQVLSGSDQAKSSSKEVGSALNFIRYFLLAFGGIALFVGAFVIANTLSITIAQRTREFATLRSMGATGRQVLAVVTVEGFVTGLLASTVGLFVGLGLAKGLDQLFKAVGADLPQAGLVFATRTIVVSLVVGTVVTLLATIRPALRATRVPPIAAVREGSILPPGRFAHLAPLAATSTCVVGLGIVLYAAFGHGIATGQRLLMLGLGVVLLFIGIAMLAPKAVRPLASVLGWPATRIGGVAGSLARSNSIRNPARTASTAAALMIGLALVTAVSVLAAGLRGAFDSAVRGEFGADYALTSQDGFTPTSAASAAALRRSGIATVVAGVRAGDGRAFGKTIGVTGLEPGLAKVLTLKWKDGANASLDGLGADGAVVSSDFASSHHLTIGSDVRVETPAGKLTTLVVRSVYTVPRAGNPLGDVSMSAAAFDRLYTNPQNVYTLVDIAGGVTSANTARLNAVLRSYPDAKIQTAQQFISNQEQGLNTLLALLYVLLGLSIIVSLFGIVNTLILTVFERTREIGMLRAVGMTRRQVRRMIRHEAIVTALIGAALGIPVGMGLAALLGKALRDIPFTVPVSTLIVFVIVAIIVGFLAAIAPARRASRLNVLNALQYE